MVESKTIRSFKKRFKKNYFYNHIFNENVSNVSLFNKRTNNICEWFHKKLNNIIDWYHPKLAYLIQKLKDFSIYSYNQYKIQKTLFKNEINSGFNIADDEKNYKSLPNFNDILQLNESEEDNINNLIMPIIDLLYDFDFDENESGCELTLWLRQI